MGKFKNASNPVKHNKPGNSFSTDEELGSKENASSPLKTKEGSFNAVAKPKADQRIKTFSRDTEVNIPISNEDPW